MSGGTSPQTELESAASSSFLEPAEPGLPEERSMDTTEEPILQETLPGMTLRGMALPERILQKKDVRIVYNKNLSNEERNAIGERTKRIFAEKRAKRKLVTERLLEHKRMKMAQRDANTVESTNPLMATISVPAIGERIVSLEREGRFKGSFEVNSDNENEDKDGDIDAMDVDDRTDDGMDVQSNVGDDKDVSGDGPGTAQEENVDQQYYVNPHNSELMEDAEGNVFHVDEDGTYHRCHPIFYYPVDPEQPVQIIYEVE
uniref:BZIP domain-containing protein n=1 Tax=Panagrellus redivivus TaxID=6233 RepID=A0A7E5A1F1_PANRE